MWKTDIVKKASKVWLQEHAELCCQPLNPSSGHMTKVERDELLTAAQESAIVKLLPEITGKEQFLHMTEKLGLQLTKISVYFVATCADSVFSWYAFYTVVTWFVHSECWFEIWIYLLTSGAIVVSNHIMFNVY